MRFACAQVLTAGEAARWGSEVGQRGGAARWGSVIVLGSVLLVR